MDSEIILGSVMPGLMPAGCGTTKIRFGSRVDTYLDAHEAIAQAVEGHTILLGTSFLEMHPLDQHLILLHEIAHLQQLARHGHDPTRALEAEAWEAAHAWAAGKDYHIRGRGRGRLSALALIQGKPNGASKPDGPLTAPPWYRLKPGEPIGSPYVSSILVQDFTVLDNMTLESILDAILLARLTAEILINCHGSTFGLAIPLIPGSPAGAEFPNIERLLAEHEKEETVGGRKIITPPLTNQKLAEIFNMPETRVGDLRDKMHQVQRRKLSHVAFRSCDMGAKKESLTLYCKFFGARGASAPKIFDSYGELTPTFGVNLNRWADRQRKDGFHAWIDGNVAVAIQFDPRDHTRYRNRCAATSEAEFKSWVGRRIGLGALVGRREVVYHGMVPEDPETPISPNIFFVRDPDYASNLVDIGLTASDLATTKWNYDPAYSAPGSY